MKLKFIIAALIIVAAVSCQQKGETALEVNLTDIPENFRIDVSRVEGRGGQTIYTDSSKTTDRKFTIKCDSITDNTSFSISLQKITDKGQALAYTGTILVADGYTTKVTGKGIYPSTWTIDSKHPKQAFVNKMNDAVKDLNKQIDELRLSSDTVSSRESQMKLYNLQDEIYDQIEEKQIALMETLPMDEYWLEELCRFSGAINYEGKDYKYYDKVEALYNKMPDEYKNSKIGKAINLALYAKAPAVGDQINDYDLYDIDGKVHHLADFKGKWLLLDFSSYFCGPCRMFDASVKYFYERGIGKDFAIITITADTEGQFAQMVAKEKPLHLLLNDRDGWNGLFAINKISATPTCYIVNPNGKIEDIFEGADMGKIIKLMKEHGGFAAPTYTTENGASIITKPEFSHINGGLLIDKVEIYKDSVVINCTYPMPGGFSMANHTALFSNGKCISKITKSSIGYDKYVSAPLGEVGHCHLTFEPLPKGTKQFDFIEGDCENCFRVMGVKIEN